MEGYGRIYVNFDRSLNTWALGIMYVDSMAVNKGKQYGIDAQQAETGHHV